MADPRLSIVLPAYNEASRLPATLEALTQQWSGRDAEVIVVDDGSTDATSDIARELLRNFSRGRVLKLPANCGKGAAVRIGMLEAHGRLVAFMDADLATNLRSLPGLLGALESADVAIGSRAAEGAVVEPGTRTRTAMARAFNRIARTLTGLTLLDTQCGFKAFRASAAQLLFRLTRTNGFAFDVEVLTLASHLGLAVVEVPVQWRAIDGTRVRAVGDSFRMSRDLLRIALLWRPERAVAAAQQVVRELPDVALTPLMPSELMLGHSPDTRLSAPVAP
jgi:glycosyltransferase involved in cell wall biosynthesis